MRLPRRRIVLSIAGAIVALIAAALFLAFRDDTPIAQLPDGRKIAVGEVDFSKVEWKSHRPPQADHNDLSLLRSITSLPRSFVKTFSLPSPPRYMDFRVNLSLIPLSLGKQVHVSQKLVKASDSIWIAFSLGMAGTNGPVKVTARKWVQAAFDSIRTNGVSFIDEKGRGKVVTNYPCVIITSPKEIRILTEGEFEAISSRR